MQPLIDASYEKGSWFEQYGDVLKKRKELQEIYNIQESFSDKIFDDMINGKNSNTPNNSIPPYNPYGH
ncbi:hypothetical protein AALM99_03915 [Lactococcus muris]|uniref:Uncharacterized protein n=1 Tax=Lactococcus muris TaxID=2941330 RepID=A0ABV4DAN3_9LACT|nr:hypothetical protein [Lactococcus garvieae]